MSKAVLISIRPEWCEKIINEQKTIEVRKTRPKMDTPFRCYIYCTQSVDMLWILKERERSLHPDKIADVFKAAKCGGAYRGNGKIIGEFICDRVYELAPLNHAPDDAEQQACLTQEEIARYLKGVGYGWHISNLRIYDTPRELREFYAVPNEVEVALKAKPKPVTRPPQSWRYVEEELWND